MPALPPPRSPVRSDWITIPADPGGGPAAVDLPGWWALPEQGEPCGGILVLPEVFGVNPWVRSVVDRLAGEGYAALAISTFARSAPALELGYTDDALIQGREHRDRVTADQLLLDAATAADWLRRRIGSQPLGCVGFCFGGHLALIAATLPCFAATCDFYGARVSSSRPGGGPASLDLVPRVPGRLWCFVGDADPLIPNEEIAAIEAALTAANGGASARDAAARHRLIIAANAGHGYLCEARSDFRPQAAAEGWQAMLALFAATLRSEELAAPQAQDPATTAG